MKQENFEKELAAAWKELEEKKFKNQQNKTEVMNTIKMDSSSTITQLKKDLKKKIYWALGITIAIVIFLIAQRSNPEMLKLLGFGTAVYIIGTVAMYVAYLKIDDSVNDKDILSNLKASQKQIQRVLRIELIWGMFTFIPAIVVGMLIGKVRKGYTIAESFSDPSFLKSMIIAVIILVPIMYFLTDKMNKIAYAKNLKKLDENITKMETLS